MKTGKKLIALIVLLLLAGLSGVAHPAQSQESVQPKLVVFESVGSVE
ncbi:MAG: hypothetical protein GX797_02050 [Chloroflexi bacterium]|jgi:uncharacterized protein YggE|nr:hypothetical protein [Chloroflexota bacterium]